MHQSRPQVGRPSGGSTPEDGTSHRGPDARGGRERVSGANLAQAPNPDSGCTLKGGSNAPLDVEKTEQDQVGVPTSPPAQADNPAGDEPSASERRSG